MRTFLKKLSAFSAFAIVFYIIWTIFWGLYLPQWLKPNINYRIGSGGHLNSRIKDLKTYGNVDVLILGSSHAYRGYDVRIFESHGIRAFNLGSSAQTPLQTEILLNRYLDQLNPKLIIYDTSPGTLSSDGVESAMDVISNDMIDIDTIKMALQLNHMKVYNTLIYGSFRELLSLNSNFIEDIRKGDDTYINGGYVEKELQIFNDNEIYTSSPWNLVPYQVKAFENTINKLRARGIVVILVQAPIISEFYNSHSNNVDMDDYFQTLDGYYNFNNLLELENRYFYDANHLNQDGVEIFNEELIKVLTAAGYLDFK